MAEVIDFSSRAVLARQPASRYRAFAPSGQEAGRLFLISRDPNEYLILRYAELESIGPVRGVDANRAVLLRFGGSVAREVRIDGRRLLDLVSLLRWHRVEVVEEAPDGWDNDRDDVTSVSRITIREMTR